MLLEVIFIFLLGAIFGLFLNVLILRLRKDLTILGRSVCPHCQEQLKPRHLVPILSWICLGGRCAFCRVPIHVQYPLVELASAALFVLAYLRHPFFIHLQSWPIFLIESLFLLTLLALVVFDLRWKLLPIEPIVAMTVIMAVWNIFSKTLSWKSVMVGILVAGFFLGIQVWLSQGRAMGGGDPWLGMLMGAALGWPRVGVALYLTYVVGGGIVLVLYLLGIVRKGSRIPFAPLLALGTLGAMMVGDRMEVWVRGLL